MIADKLIYITLAILAMINFTVILANKSLATSTNIEVINKNSPYMERENLEEFKKYLSTPPLILAE